MQCDWDLIRSILLWAEHHCDGSYIVSADMIILSGYTPSEINGHLKLLENSGFLINDYGTNSKQACHIYFNRLSRQGQHYLNAVRNDMIWRRTKSVLALISLPLTLSLVQDLAVAIIKSSLGF